MSEIVLEEFPSAADMSEEELANECFIDCEEEEMESEVGSDEDIEEDEDGETLE